MPKYTPAQRISAFWAKVDKSAGPDGCWRWTAAKSPLGYGRFGWERRRTVLSHRIAYELAFGPFPSELNVCHHCDNPPCCNPAHLFLGTQAENLADMGRKKRYKVPVQAGEKHPGCKLSDVQVAEIRRLYQTGELSQRKLAKQFGVTQAHISLLVRGESRTNV